MADSGFEGDETDAAVEDCDERIKHYESLKHEATTAVATARGC
jgi:hypothetical protein